MSNPLDDFLSSPKPKRVKGERRFGKRKGEVRIPLRKRVKFPDVGGMNKYGGYRTMLSKADEKRDLKRILIWWIVCLVAVGLMIWWLAATLNKESGRNNEGIGVEQIVDMPELNVHGERFDAGVSTSERQYLTVGEPEGIAGAYSAKWYEESIEISDYLVNKYDLEWNFHYVIAEEDWGYWVTGDDVSGRYAFKVNKSINKDNLYSILLGQNLYDYMDESSNNVVAMGGVFAEGWGYKLMGVEVGDWSIAGVQTALDNGVATGVRVTVMAGVNGDELGARVTEYLGGIFQSGTKVTVVELSSVGGTDAENQAIEDSIKVGNYGKLADSQIVNSFEVVLP